MLPPDVGWGELPGACLSTRNINKYAPEPNKNQRNSLPAGVAGANVSVIPGDGSQHEKTKCVVHNTTTCDGLQSLFLPLNDATLNCEECAPFAFLEAKFAFPVLRLIV